MDDLARDVDEEEHEERRVVINMVVEEDDSRCKVLLASGLWSIFPIIFMLVLAQLQCEIYRALRRANLISCQF